jgi:hypothetical protein
MRNRTKTRAKLLDLPLEVRAEMALKAAVRKVIEQHIQTGQPICVWRDGKVVEVPAKELRADS